jgi:ketosteroid isomerase-like protein
MTRPAATSSEEITATIERLIEAFNRGDYEAATAVARPDAEFVRSWEKSSLRGPAAIQAWMEPDAFDKQHTTVLSVTVAGDKALVRQNFRARGATSGIDVDIESWGVWTFGADGLVTRLEVFLHHEEDQAREAAGVPA